MLNNFDANWSKRWTKPRMFEMRPPQPLAHEGRNCRRRRCEPKSGRECPNLRNDREYDRATEVKREFWLSFWLSSLDSGARGAQAVCEEHAIDSTFGSICGKRG